jgi:hypothetical protein
MQQVQRQRQQEPTPPPIDPDFEEFVLFFRSPQTSKKWTAFNIIKGGTQANNLVRAMKGKVGDGVLGSTLTRNIANVCSAHTLHA